MRRAYLNPAGSIYDTDLGNDSGRVYFQRFRPNLVRAGFEVVDCPALTIRHKNAADIRITLDILESLDADTEYEDFIVASSDSDFTPLLQRLRASDRRTTIISAGETATAYRSVASVYIGATDLIQMLVDDGTEHSEEPDPTALAARVSAEAVDSGSTEVRREATKAVEERDGSMLLADLGLQLREKFEDEINRTGWFGTGTLGEYMRSIGFQTEGHYVWDPERQSRPGETEGNVERVCRIAGQPRLSSQKWSDVLRTLAEYISLHEFNLTQCTGWTRDRLASQGVQVGRSAIGYVVLGAIAGGLEPKARPLAREADIRRALIRNMIVRAQAASLSLTESDEDDLRKWLGGAAS